MPARRSSLGRAAGLSVLPLILACASLVVPAQALALPPFGALNQLAGVDGCIGDAYPAIDCIFGIGLLNPNSVTASPDGRNVYVTSYSDTVAVLSRDASSGKLTQLAGTDGCISDEAVPGCTTGKALHRTASVTVSPDGNNVYVASYLSDAVAVFSRDANSGNLTQLAGTDGCVSDDGTDGHGNLGTCVDVKALDGATSVTISPDGKNAYVATYVSDAVAIFTRDPGTGKLTQLATGTKSKDGCINNESIPGVDCTTLTTGKALDGATSVTVSPDGNNAYIASKDSNAVAVFNRYAATGGKLTQHTSRCLSNEDISGCTTLATGKALGGATSVTVSPDGNNAYVASSYSNAVAVFSRDASGKLTQPLQDDNGEVGCIGNGNVPGCTTGKAIDGAASVTVSPDGSNAYVASYSSDAVAAFSRDASSGKLTQLADPSGCITGNNAVSGLGGCAEGEALIGATSVAVSPDGGNAYVASFNSGRVAIFSRRGDELAPTCADASQTVAAGAATAVALDCADPNGDPLTLSVVSGPGSGSLGAFDQAAGTVTYTPSQGFTGADSFTFQASDGEQSSQIATLGLTVLAGSPTAQALKLSVGGTAVVSIFDRSLRLNRRGFTKVRLTCRADTGERCQGTLALKTAERRDRRGKRAATVSLGKGEFSIAGGQDATVKVRLSKAGRRLVERQKRVRVKITANPSDPSASAVASGRTVTLKGA